MHIYTTNKDSPAWSRRFLLSQSWQANTRAIIISSSPKAMRNSVPIPVPGSSALLSGSPASLNGKVGKPSKTLRQTARKSWEQIPTPAPIEQPMNYGPSMSQYVYYGMVSWGRWDYIDYMMLTAIFGKDISGWMMSVLFFASPVWNPEEHGKQHWNNSDFAERCLEV